MHIFTFMRLNLSNLIQTRRHNVPGNDKYIPIMFLIAILLCRRLHSSSFIIIVRLPILEYEKLAVIPASNLLPHILDLVEHRVIESKIHRRRWET